MRGAHSGSVACSPVVVDVCGGGSGGFTELSSYGEWRTDPAEYVYWVDPYDSEIRMLNWAAPQD
jgi:hypothetical protein